MLAFHQHGAPLGHMTVEDCIRVLESDCDPESARLVAYELRRMQDGEDAEKDEIQDHLEAENEDLLAECQRLRKKVNKLSIRIQELEVPE